MSAVEQLASSYRFLAEDTASKSESNISPAVWQKSDAIKKIKWFADRFKDKVGRYLSHEEGVRISAKVDVISNEVISQLNDHQLRSDLFNKIGGIFKEIIEQILYENPLVIKQPDHFLSKEDFQIAEVSNYEEYISNKRVSYCYDFAFYLLNEEKSFPYIFNSEFAKWPAEFFNDSKNYLASWGYEEVKEPSPGDLAVYSYMGKSQHFGIWTHDGNVLSKLGMIDVVKHPIDDVVLGYGDDVSFFRKKIKSLLLNNYINELDKAHQSLPDFSHSIVASPLNTLGCVKKIIEIFESMQILKVFKNSIYNIDYNNELQRETLLKLNTYSVSVSGFTQKSEAIETVRKIVLLVSDQKKTSIGKI
ncbi:MAG: hypothetical protein AB7E63_10220 [Parachlamydia sp.]